MPSADALRQSASKVNEIFGTDAKGAITPEAKSEFSSSLLGHAAETANPTDCFVLLDAARSIAGEAGDIETAFKAIDAMADRYAVNRPGLRAAVLENAATKATPASAAKVVGTILETVARLKAAGDYDGAEKAAQVAATAARRGKDRDLQKVVLEQLAAIREQRKSAAKVQALVDRVAADPADGDAAADLGRYRCFAEDDWESGLPLLARGSDAELAALAKADLAGAATLAARLQLADRWWEYAASHKGPDVAATEARARMHYGLALGELQGLDKARVLKRLETSLLGGRSLSKRPKDLVLWLDASAAGSLRGPDGRVFDKSQMREMPVAEWVDLGGVRAAARQKNPAHLPTARAGVFGKLPSISCDGKSYLAVDMPPPAQGTIAIAFKVGTANAVMNVLGAPADKSGIRLGARDTGAVNFMIFRNHATVDIILSPDGLLQASRATVVTTTWPNPFGLRFNGQAFPAKEPARLDASEGAAVVVGAMDDRGSFPLVGDIGEIRVYSRILSAGEIAAVESELNGKWNSSR
ncbi:MAG: hypothetical protein ACKOYJ_10100 [Planctomycetia bacterium]